MATYAEDSKLLGYLASATGNVECARASKHGGMASPKVGLEIDAQREIVEQFVMSPNTKRT
jgi:hypothetical protein